MGNWRSVNIVGTIPEEHIEPMTEYFTLGDYKDGGWDRFNPLSIMRSIFGLPDWVQEEVKAIGNLSERDYSVESIAEVLKLIAKKWPGCKLKVHCGGDYEDKTCIATIALEDDKVETRYPEVKMIDELSKEDIMDNLISSLTDGRLDVKSKFTDEEGEEVKCICNEPLYKVNDPETKIIAGCKVCMKGFIEAMIPMLGVYHSGD